MTNPTLAERILALPLPEVLEIDWPRLNSHALGCGVEDRNIHDRYDAANYGFEEGVDSAASRVPDKIYTEDQVQALLAQAAALAAAQEGQEAVAYGWINAGTERQQTEYATLSVGPENPWVDGANAFPVYLHAHRAAQEADAWQPIETAPRDRIIMLGRAEQPGEVYAISIPGRWIEGYPDGVDEMGHDSGFMDLQYDCFTCPRTFGAEAYRTAGIQPTHWMPLPDAPASATTPKG